MEALTIRAAIIAGLAIAALLLTGWRKPARAEHRSPRGPLRRSSVGIPVDQVEAPPYRRPGPLRRVLALVASGGIALLAGVLTAILTAFAIAWAVVWLSDLLG